MEKYDRLTWENPWYWKEYKVHEDSNGLSSETKDDSVKKELENQFSPDTKLNKWRRE